MVMLRGVSTVRSGGAWLRAATLSFGLALLGAPAAHAEFPYPACSRADNACDPECPIGDASCIGADDYAEYLFLPAPGPGESDETPNDYAFDPDNPDSGSGWKYQGEIEGGPADGLVSGLNLLRAWQTTTGRPDVVVAVLDSGIRWSSPDIARKVALRLEELPMPADASPPVACTGPGYDCNGDGLVSVEDFDGITCQGLSGPTVVSAALGGSPTLLDGQDLIRACSDGQDGYGGGNDGNGYVDDIAGWDFHDDDNDPFDDVDYGHGTGEAQDQAGEANNGGGFPGTAPNELYLPLKVADSFVAIGTEFARATVYATDWPVDVISEALGTITVGPVGQQAVDYAYERGVPLIASAADEQAQHHNYPANYDHTIWVNSIQNGDGSIVPNNVASDGSVVNLGFDLLNGCTNFGPRAFAAIPSTGCSSEATGRSGGVAALIVSHGLNLIDRGLLSSYCDDAGDCDHAAPFSAEEVRQIFRFMTQDIDHTPDGFALNFTPTFDLVAQFVLSNAAVGMDFGTSHFPAGPGWDPITGYGRPDVARLAELVEPDGMGGTTVRIPPEADLAGGLRWFEIVDPEASSSVEVRGSARAVRSTGFDWSLQIGCGWDAGLDEDFVEIGSGFSMTAVEDAVLGSFDPGLIAEACAFDPATPVGEPDEHTVTLRLQVTDVEGNLGEDRRAVAIHHDPTQAWTRHVGASGESSPALADVDRDGVLDIVYATGAGSVHVFDGATGDDLPGFPVFTATLPSGEASPENGFGSGAVDLPREAIGGAVAADDLDGDGGVEIVAVGTQGGIYVWDETGNPRPGFPVQTNPAFSAPENRNRLNDADPGLFSAPTLADLDPAGVDPALEIIAGAMDGYLYAWRADGSLVTGFPVRLADTSLVSVDPNTGASTPLPGTDAKSRARKIIGSPAVGDLTGDGRPEIIVGTTEEYGDSPTVWSAPSSLFGLLATLGFEDELDLDVTSRIYAVDATGEMVDGWPVAVPLLISQLLPSVATGTSTSVALADTDGNGSLEAVVHGYAGPALVVNGAGEPILGDHNGLPRSLAIDFAGGGFPGVPPEAGSADGPFFPTLGSGAFGDIDQDGLPEWVAPTAGFRKLLDVLVPGQQFGGDHQIAAWNADPASLGELVPAFPQPMEDMQFIASPGLADVTGDGVPEVVQGSGTYLVRAFEILDEASEAAAAGVPVGSAVQPAGWPKLTMGWIITSPLAGDVDGDGLVEIVVGTREGDLFVWDTPAPATATSIPWQGFGHDRRNTQNHESNVSPLAAARAPMERLLWTLDSLDAELDAMTATHPELANTFGGQILPWVRGRIAGSLATGQPIPQTDLALALVSLLLPYELEGLMAPLRDRLIASVDDTAEAEIAAVACAGGDAACEACRDDAAAQLAAARTTPNTDFEDVAKRSAALRAAQLCAE